MPIDHRLLFPEHLVHSVHRRCAGLTDRIYPRGDQVRQALAATQKIGTKQDQFQWVTDAIWRLRNDPKVRKRSAPLGGEG